MGATTMTRWTVKRHHGWSGDLQPGWLVFGDPQWARGKWFPTWREALDYADRRARTVEVELPRLTGQVRLPAHNGTPGGHPCGYTLIPQDEEHYCAITISGPWGKCGIYDPQDIKPLALALLAHHYKENQ